MVKVKLWHGVKVVTSRKEHKCASCDKPIPKGTRVLVEFGKNETEGYYQNYFHTDLENACHLDYVDAMFPSDDTVQKIKDSSFFGEIEYEHWRKEVV